MIWYLRFTVCFREILMHVSDKWLFSFILLQKTNMVLISKWCVYGLFSTLLYSRYCTGWKYIIFHCWSFLLLQEEANIKTKAPASTRELRQENRRLQVSLQEFELVGDLFKFSQLKVRPESKFLAGFLNEKFRLIDCWKLRGRVGGWVA